MKKTLNIIKKIFTWLLVIAAVAMMLFTIVSVSTFDRNDRDLFGFRAYIVRSDSMSSENGDVAKGHFNAGDLIFVKEVDASGLKAGDIISYISTNTENFGETVTHMIKSLATDAQGRPGFVTYGTATGVEDSNIVTYGYVLGKYQGKLPGVGTFFSFLKTTPGYIICILLPFLLLIGMQGFHSIRLFRKYKAEQLREIEQQREKELAALEAERAAMAEERRRQEEMLQKLFQMQAAMQKSAAPTEAASATEEDSSAT